MCKIIQFTPSFKKGSESRDSSTRNQPPRTPEEVRRFVLGMDEDYEEEKLHIHVTFIPLDENRTALIGDFAAIRSLIGQLGTITERKRIRDPQGKYRGPGIILSVPQVKKLVDMMEEDGWDDLNPDIRRSAEARYKALVKTNPIKMRAAK